MEFPGESMKRLLGFTQSPSYVPLLLFLLLVGLYALRPLVVNLRGYFDLSAPYLVSYQEFGFIKRGFIGTFLTGLGVPVTRWTLSFLFVGFVVGLFVMAIVFFRWATQEVGRHTPFVRNLAILCALSPCTFMHFGRALGRFDVINVILLMGAIMIVPRGRGWYAGALAAIGMLIHEGFIFTGYPVLLLVALTHKGGGGTCRGTLAPWRIARCNLAPSQLDPAPGFADLPAGGHSVHRLLRNL